MTAIEVEFVNNTQSQRRRVDRAGCSYRCVPMLELHITFDCQIVSQVAIQAPAEGVHEGIGADEQGVAIDITGLVIIDLAAAKEELGVRTEPSYGIFDFRAKKEVFLAADVALVDGIAAASFKRRAEAGKTKKGDVCSGGDGQIFATGEVSEGAGSCDKCGELQLLGSGRGGLRGCDVGEGGDGGEQSYSCRKFCMRHSFLKLVFLK